MFALNPFMFNSFIVACMLICHSVGSSFQEQFFAPSLNVKYDILSLSYSIWLLITESLLVRMFFPTLITTQQTFIELQHKVLVETRFGGLLVQTTLQHTNICNY